MIRYIGFILSLYILAAPAQGAVAATLLKMRFALPLGARAACGCVCPPHTVISTAPAPSLDEMHAAWRAAVGPLQAAKEIPSEDAQRIVAEAYHHLNEQGAFAETSALREFMEASPDPQTAVDAVMFNLTGIAADELARIYALDIPPVVTMMLNETLERIVHPTYMAQKTYGIRWALELHFNRVTGTKERA